MLRRFNYYQPSSSISRFINSNVALSKRHQTTSSSIQTVCPTAETSWKVVKSTKFFITLARNPFNIETNEIQTDKEELLQIPLSWISHNSLNRRHACGQRTETLEQQMLRSAKIQKKVVEITKAEVAQHTCPKTETQRDAIEIKLSDGTSEWISFDHLSKYAARPPLCPLPKSIVSSLPREDPSSNPRDAIRSPQMLHGAENIQRVQFDSLSLTALVTDEKAHKDKDLAMLSLYRDGLCIVENCPNTTESVVRLADFFGAPAGAMSTLYGRNWIVESQPQTGPKNNIALTAEFLDLHNDLVYYQSMPGLQLLHCIRFDDAVTGGESFFGDSFIAAERLRDENPVAFEVLCRVPCAFAKDDFDREVPASYYYATPIISCDMMTGQVNCVRWAPAFEVPSALGGYMPSHDEYTFGSSEEGDAQKDFGVKTNHKTSAANSLNSNSDVDVMSEYFEAYNEFAKILQKVKEEQNLKFKMKPGECIVFNQARMLHGREKFVEPSAGMRKLSGAYVNIDDFRSRCMARFALSLPKSIRTPNWTFSNGGSR